MGISIYSLASGIIFFNIGLLLIKIFRKNTGFLVKNSTTALAVLSVFTLVRVLLPVDLKHAAVIPSGTVLPWLLNLLKTPLGGGVTLAGFFIGIWALGTAAAICRSLYFSVKELRQLKRYRVIEDPRIQALTKECLGSKATVSVSPDAEVPKVIGINRAHIYMPPLDLSDEAIKLILQHEFQHIKGRDFPIKLLYLCLQAVFWWNPVVHLFRKEVVNLLELRCDAAVTGHMAEERKIDYLEAILGVMRQSVSKGEKKPVNVMALVDLNAQKLIKQRFSVVLNKSAEYSKRKLIQSICVMAIAFLCSYFVIVQPVYPPPEIPGSITVTRDNAYILRDGENRLQLYVDGEFFGTLTEEERKAAPHNELKIIDKEENDAVDSHPSYEEHK